MLKPQNLMFCYTFLVTLQPTLLGINISHPEALLKMILLFQWWDMLVSWRVSNWSVSLWRFGGCARDTQTSVARESLWLVVSWPSFCGDEVCETCGIGEVLLMEYTPAPVDRWLISPTVCKVLYIPGGAGILPSTVWKFLHHINI